MPAQDAEALAQVLEDPRIAGFEVRVLLNAFLYTLSGKQFVAVDTATFQVVRRLGVDWSGVVSMVVSADGFRVYSTDIYSDGIQVVNTAGNKLIGAIQIPG
jgi:DNA-binding beta-propeller fold protein YncE